jgi:hypothetical protein
MTIPKGANYGDTLGKAVRLAMKGDKEKCDKWFDELVTHIINYGVNGPYTKEKAEEIVRGNIGYFAGYYGEEERRAVSEMYSATHPIFGNNFKPTAKEAFDAGVKLAKGDTSVIEVLWLACLPSKQDVPVRIGYGAPNTILYESGHIF